MVQNPPANAEDTGSIPGAGGSRVPRGREASATAAGAAGGSLNPAGGE